MAKTDAQLIDQNDDGIRGAIAAQSITKIIHADMNKDLIESKVNRLDTPSRTSVNPAVSVILDFVGKQKQYFVLSAPIGAAKTWSLSNAGNGQEFKAKFVLSNAGDIQTVPSSWIVNAGIVDNVAHTWTPTDPGTYIADGFFDGTNWYVTMQGPF